MKRILILVIALVLTLPAFAQVGRYKNIKLMYPGYSLKLDTATGELKAVHRPSKADYSLETVISKRQSNNAKEIGRYEFRRTRTPGTYQIFDTATGEYTTLKWKPEDKKGKEIGEKIDTVVNDAVQGVKKVFKDIGEGFDKKKQKDTTVVTM